MLLQPRWLHMEAILSAHTRQLAEHGGQEGVRDSGLLISALNRPRNLWAYTSLKPSIPLLAASYAFGIAKNHPFHDGNKRISAIACEGFLSLNGYQLECSDNDWADAIYRLAAGKIDEIAFSNWLLEKARPIDRLEK